VLAVFTAALLCACGGVTFTPGGTTQFSLSSGAFVAEFQADAGAASHKYANKVVELTGKLSTVGYDREGKPLFYLDGPDPKKLERAACTMADRFPWQKATPGQTVTLKGKGPSFGLTARLVDCAVLEVKGDPAPRLTADEFAEQGTAKSIPFRPENEFRHLIVSGEIDRIDPGNSGLFLKTKAKEPGALIHFSPEEYKRLGVASWAPGQKVEVIGMDSSNRGAKWAWLVNSLPMDDPK
jgi:hypothetical protein